MTTKEKFMAIKDYEEYKSKKDEFKGKLDMSDSEIRNHLDEIFPTTTYPGYDDKNIHIDFQKNKRKMP